MRQPKPPVAEWIIAERKRHGWKVEEVSRRLVEMGYSAEVSTVRVWEAGRSPKPETIEALERLFDSTAPREVAGSLDQQRLFDLMVEQTEAIHESARQQQRVADALLQLIVRMDLDQREAREQRLAIAELLGELHPDLSETPGVSEPAGRARRKPADAAPRTGQG